MLADGLYQVTTSYLCAGFIVEQGKVVACAPILRRKLRYWTKVATLVALNTEGAIDAARRKPACVE